MKTTPSGSVNQTVGRSPRQSRLHRLDVDHRDDGADHRARGRKTGAAKTQIRRP